MTRLSQEELENFQSLAKAIRRNVLTMIYKTKSPHVGCSLSIVDLLIALYFKVLSVYPEKPDHQKRDRFVLSKGHGCATLYAVLAERGIIAKDLLEKFANDGAIFEQHPNRDPSLGIEITAGSLGHGLSIAAGMALSAKYDNTSYRTFVFLGDGELNEGSNWEAMLFASHHKLDNLVAIVDYNKLQAIGKGCEILNLEPLAQKWQSFGWDVKEVDGHNIEEILTALDKIPFQEERPSCLIAHTTKGKGVSFMENDWRWHDKYPNEEEYQKALAELQ